MKLPKSIEIVPRLAALACLGLLVLGSVASSQIERRGHDPDLPEAEFHLARLRFPTYRTASSRGAPQPMWRVDYPDAEYFFLPALARYTGMSVAPAIGEEQIRHFELTDERIFDYPFLWLQEPAAAGWNPSDREVAALREYLDRGGFFMVDDFHGQNEFYQFQSVMSRVFPDREMEEIHADDPMVTAFFDLEERVQIPGARHVRGCSRTGTFSTSMQGPPYWLGIYDDDQRLVSAIYYNIDMGDAWEHADDPCYPIEMTGQAYELGVNTIVYAMTH